MEELMPKYIIDTDKLSDALRRKKPNMRQFHIMEVLRALMKGVLIADWLETLDEQKPAKKGASIGGYSPAFLKFWEVYPPRNGTRVGKAMAMKAWKKVKGLPEPELLKACLVSLEWQKQDEAWIKENGTFIPMPTTYLNQRRWEDEGNSPDDWEEYLDINGVMRKRRKN